MAASRMRLAGLLAVVVAACHLSLSEASNCPAFASSKAACSSSSCGHFLFKGKFRTHGTEQFRVAAAKSGIRLGKKAAPADCCQQCRMQSSCAYWNFFSSSGLCLLYTAAICGSGNEVGPVYSAKQKDSYVGGRCNSAAHSERYYLGHEGAADHEDLPDGNFCLLSDRTLHVNMQLSGYRDNRSEVLSSSTGTKVRTWIRQVGLLWVSAGRQHSLRMSARRGPQQERGEGYMGEVEVDGVAVPKLALGDELNLFDGQAVLSFDSYEKVGPYDVDLFLLKIEGLMEAEIRLRVAHPLLQQPDDAMVHLNMDIVDVRYSPTVHGILGQTYRADSSDKELNYAVLASLMSTDGELKPLDGRVSDYTTSSVLSPDCKFSQYAFLHDIASDQATLESGGYGGNQEANDAQGAAIGFADNIRTLSSSSSSSQAASQDL